jgi:hypothetical protein
MQKILPCAVILYFAVLIFTAPDVQAAAASLTPQLIENGSGSQATVTPDGVVRIGWPRNDVPVQVDGVPLPPAAGLGSWAAFKYGLHGTMMMGDTVVFQDEVDAAMDAAFASGLEVTALHNHFFYDEPRVYFMHIAGYGDPRKLAVGVKTVWDAIKQVRAMHALPGTGFENTRLAAGHIDPKAVEETTGFKAIAPSDSVVKVSAGRDASMHGTVFGESMGLNTWAAFVGSEENATIDGDFAMTTTEVAPVLKTLRAHGLHVVALHNHMIGESPQIFFAHYWGRGAVSELGRAFRAALEAQRGVNQGHRH